jgi:hypothetical protein
VSKKTTINPPVKEVDGFAIENARCVTAIDTIEHFASPYRRPNEEIVECVLRLLAEVLSFRADEMHKEYVDHRNRNREALKGGAK